MTKPAFGSATQFTDSQVLVVDDDEAFLEVLTKQLESMGCKVQATSDASAFLGDLATTQKKYDLAVIDIELPGLKGDQIISWMRDSELYSLNSMPIIIVTGYPFGLPASLPIGKNLAVLAKPYEFGDLKAAVERLLSQGTRH